MKLRSLIIAGAALSALAVAPAAQAGTTTQAVTGVTSSAALSIGTVSAAAFPTLGTDSAGYSTILGTVPVVAIGGWSMTVYGSAAGKLVNTLACGVRAAATSTTNPVMIIPPTALISAAFTPAISSNTALAGSGSPVSLGTGTGTNTVNLNYSWTPDTAGADADVLPAACELSQTSTVTVTAS